MSTIRSIGFIGLGAMGGAMARNLLTGGFCVHAFDLDTDAIGRVVAAGARAAATPRTAAEPADLVITMLPNAPHVESVLTGEDGVLSLSGEGRLLMNSSTIDPDETRRFAALARAAGWGFLDCPVGRTASDAVAGTSLFMLAGSEADKAKIGPVLEAMGNAIIDCGNVGQAATIKMVNNYLSIVTAVTTAEALRLAEANGVSAEQASAVINQTIAMNGHTKIHYPNKVLKGDVAPGFALEHAAKDLGIAARAMERKGLKSFVAPGSQEAYAAALAEGRGKNDWSDLYNFIDGLWQKGSSDNRDREP